MGVDASKQLRNTLFELKFTAKNLIRMSQKATKEEKSAKRKLKGAIEKGNHEGARIYAANVRRQTWDPLFGVVSVFLCVLRGIVSVGVGVGVGVGGGVCPFAAVFYSSFSEHFVPESSVTTHLCASWNQPSDNIGEH